MTPGETESAPALTAAAAKPHPGPSRATKVAQAVVILLACILLTRVVTLSQIPAGWFSDMDYPIADVTDEVALLLYQDGRYPWDGWRFLLSKPSLAIQEFLICYALVFGVTLSFFIAARRRMPLWTELAVVLAALGVNLARPSYISLMPALVGTVGTIPIITILEASLLLGGMIAFCATFLSAWRTKSEV